MLDTFITEINKAELDRDTALNQLGEFLLQKSKPSFNEEKLTSILPAVYSFCYDRFKSTGGLKKISYSTFSGEDNLNKCAYAFRNKIAVNQSRYMLPKLDIYDRYDLLNSLIHEHRHVGDYYDESLKSNATKHDKDQSYISNADYHIKDFIENWCSLENPHFKGNSETRTDAENLYNLLQEQYTFDRGEISARSEALSGLGEILKHLKTKHLSPIEKFRLYKLRSIHNSNKECELGRMVTPHVKVSDEVMKEYKNYIEHSIYTKLPEAMKSIEEARQIPLSSELGKPSLSDDSERYKKIQRAEDKIDNIATKIVVGLNIQYDEKLANDFFNIYMEYANNSTCMVNKLSSFINRTEFVPNENQMLQIAKFIFEKGSSPKASLAYLMEDFYSLKSEYILDSFMKIDENFEQTIKEYTSDFMPIADSDKEVLILKYNLEKEQPDENFNDYINEILLTDDETMDTTE